MLSLLIMQAVIITLYMSAWFVVAQVIKRNDIADILWGTGFMVASGTALLVTNEITWRGLLVFVFVVIWGTRLAIHIYHRNRGKPEDPRYRKWRLGWGEHTAIGAYLQVFLLQGLLIVVISIPVTYIIRYGQSTMSIYDVLGVCIWLTGFFFEAMGDYQLVTYKRNPESRGKIMTEGLWTYTRHPNYFGEVTLWWGIYGIALALPHGWATIIGPITITFLILRVSGIPLLEEKYKDNPEFQAYKRRTSAFFPLPPRKEA